MALTQKDSIKTIEHTLNVENLSEEQLKYIKQVVEQRLKDLDIEIRRSVRVEKVKDGQFKFTTKDGKIFLAKKFGTRDRFKVFKLVPGVKPNTFKTGEVVDQEYSGGVQDLRMSIARGAMDN